MKLVIWGATETGKSSLVYNIKNHLNLPKYTFKDNQSFVINNDEYIVKALIDDRLTEEGIINFLNDNNGAKHLLIYRKDLLSQFLGWYHIEALHNNDDHDYTFNVDEISIVHCKSFMENIRKNTNKIYNILKQNTNFLYTLSYEELFLEDNSVYKLNDLGFNFTNKHQDIIINNIKNTDAVGVKSCLFVKEGIEQYSHKKGFDIVKDLFSDERLVLE